MERRGRLLVLLCLVCCPAVSAQRKNVLLLLGMGDEAGVETGFYNHTVLQTPHLDALAAKSVVFTKAYKSDSSSAPGRAVLLSGLPSHQNGMYGLSTGVNHFSSLDTITSLPALLSANHVRTGMIGTKQVKPDSVYRFDYEATEEHYDYNNIGRNITLIKNLVQQFLSTNTSTPFFLTVSLADPERCTNNSRYGQFCEKLGNGQSGMGSISDWKPVSYTADNVSIPYYLPNNMVTRQDLANMYTAFSRMDQGVGVVLGELEKSGALDNTLVIYTAVSTIPFPHAKTNLYESGMAVPLFVSSPQHQNRWGQQTSALTSTVDLMPTVLDWFGVTYPSSGPKLTGKSLLPLTADPSSITNFNRAFSSHTMDEVSTYYPMRVVRTPQYRLIHNLNYHAPFPVSPDVADCPTFFDIVNNTRYDLPTTWFKSLPQYYRREQWELFDFSYDRFEMDNVASDPYHASTKSSLKQELQAWQELTQDPWRCLPQGVLLPDNTCMWAGNSEP